MAEDILLILCLQNDIIIASRSNSLKSFNSIISFCCLQTRPTPPHLTSAMAENILAAACENESRNAAKRMRLEAYHVSVSSCVCGLIHM